MKRRGRPPTAPLTPSEEEALQLIIAAERRLALRLLRIIYAGSESDVVSTAPISTRRTAG